MDADTWAEHLVHVSHSLTSAEAEGRIRFELVESGHRDVHELLLPGVVEGNNTCVHMLRHADPARRVSQFSANRLQNGCENYGTKGINVNVAQ